MLQASTDQAAGGRRAAWGISVRAFLRIHINLDLSMNSTADD